MTLTLQTADANSPPLSCWLEAWVVAWALMVCLSAAIEAMFEQLLTIHGVFQIADAVPPMAKITLGLLAAITFYGARGRGMLVAAVAGTVAFAGAILLPVDYFAADPPAFRTAVNLLAGALSGALFSFLHDRCNTRKAGQT